jgi:hypothetical protein
LSTEPTGGDLGPFDPAKKPREEADTSFEVELDEQPPRQTAPVYVDVVSRDDELLPIVPANWSTWSNAKNSMRRLSRRWWHIARWHAVRAPWHGLLLTWFALAGAARLIARQQRWWWVSEQDQLRQAAATNNDPDTWSRLMREARAIRLYRGVVLLVEAVALVVAYELLVHLAPLWMAFALVVAVVPLLARAGRPGRSVIGSAVVQQRYRKLRGDIVLRAYYRAGLGHPDKTDEQIGFLSTMSRDAMDSGSQVKLVLPYGRTFADAINAKSKIASGLDVSDFQVFLTRDRESVRSHTLFVADRDPLAIPAGSTPMLDCRPRDIWEPIWLGLDERGRQVLLELMWNSILIGAQPRKGKALALDTPVPTPSGWSTMGDLQAGDQVFDERGRPCRVVEAWPVRRDRPCYEVQFSDGSTIVADGEHLWQVDTRASRLSRQQRASRVPQPASPYSNDQSHRWALPQVLTTADMLGSVRIQADCRANYSVRVAGPLQSDDVELPVSPYTLGAWLGDGTAVHGMVTCQDREIITRIEQEGWRTGLNPSTLADGGCPGYRVYGLQPRLREIGVLGNKHIPTQYLRASEQQRRALLAGLLDTDGFCQNGTGVVYFAVTNERLASDVRHLVSTLGYKSTLNVKPVVLDGRNLGHQWVVTFTPSDKVFGLARKAERQVDVMSASAGHRFITAIRPVPSVPVRCITVDSPNSLYLVGETCIPTHNTFTARLIALYAALDPYVRITVVDGKKSPDWRKFVLVAHVIIFGTAPNRDGDPLEMLILALTEIKRHIERVNEILSKLPTELCPEGKLTRELARDPRFPDLFVWLLVMEEFQVYFEGESQEVNKQVAGLLSFIMAQGPSAGVILESSSQKPSGVGAGDVQRLFNRYRDNHQVRFALKCGSRDVSMAVLGGDAYQEGYDASSLPVGKEYRGVGYLYGASDDTPLVRCHLATGEDAETILLAARRHRERLGLLTGMAAGEDMARDVRDVLNDVRSVFYAGEVRISWPELAERLREQYPEHYADITRDAISAQVQGLGVTSKSVKDPKHFPSGTGQGFDLAALDAAIQKRALAGAGSA